MTDLRQPIFSTTSFPPDDPLYQERVREMEAAMGEFYLGLVTASQPSLTPDTDPVDPTGSNPYRENNATDLSPPPRSAEDYAAEAYNTISRVHDAEGQIVIYLDPTAILAYPMLAQKLNFLRFPFQPAPRSGGADPYEGTPELRYRWLDNPPADERPVINDQMNHIDIR